MSHICVAFNCICVAFVLYFIVFVSYLCCICVVFVLLLCCVCVVFHYICVRFVLHIICLIYVAFVLCLCILGGVSTIREGIALHLSSLLWHTGAQMKIKYLAKKLLASSKSDSNILHVMFLSFPIASSQYFQYVTLTYFAPIFVVL